MWKRARRPRPAGTGFKLDNVMFLIGEMEARQEGMEKDFGKYKEEQAKQIVALEGTIILARSRG